MKSADHVPQSLHHEHRHHLAQERGQASPTLAATDELTMERTFGGGFTIALRLKPDRRRLVTPVDPANERRRR